MPTPTLQRITTHYSDIEDRLRLVGENAQGEILVVWLSRRLLQRLIPILLKKIDPAQHPNPHNTLLQEFSQQAAVSGMVATPPVVPQAESATWLATAVDITDHSDRVSLCFRNTEETATLTLDGVQLRQWLEIVYQAYIKGEWTTDVWPAWLAHDTLEPLDPSAVH